MWPKWEGLYLIQFSTFPTAVDSLLHKALAQKTLQCYELRVTARTGALEYNSEAPDESGDS